MYWYGWLPEGSETTMVLFLVWIIAVVWAIPKLITVLGSEKFVDRFGCALWVLGAAASFLACWIVSQ